MKEFKYDKETLDKVLVYQYGADSEELKKDELFPIWHVYSFLKKYCKLDSWNTEYDKRIKVIQDMLNV